MTAFDETPESDDDWSLDGSLSDDADDLLGDSDLSKELLEKQQERDEIESQRAEVVAAAKAEEDQKGRESRQDVRVDVRFPLQFRLDSGGAPTKCRMRDMSATGFGFSTRTPIDREDTGRATLSLPDWTFTKPFVVRFQKEIIAGYRVGVQFIDLSDDERDKLAKVVFDVQRDQLKGA